MSKVRKAIVLHHQGRSKSFISRYLQVSRNTVKKYIHLYQLLNLDIEKITQKSDAKLEQLFCLNQQTGLSATLQAVYNFFPYMERELKKRGITKQLTWEEYLDKNPNGLMSSQFMDRYIVWSKKVNPVMHIEHKAGDIMFIDYAGKTLPIIDKDTGVHKGLGNCQARSENKLHFHFNTALTSINIARVCHWLSLPKEKREAFSMADVKTLYHNMLLIERFIDVFAVNPNKLKNQDIVKELINYGTIAA